MDGQPGLGISAPHLFDPFYRLAERITSPYRTSRSAARISHMTESITRRIGPTLACRSGQRGRTARQCGTSRGPGRPRMRARSNALSRFSRGREGLFRRCSLPCAENLCFLGDRIAFAWTAPELVWQAGRWLARDVDYILGLQVQDAGMMKETEFWRLRRPGIFSTRLRFFTRLDDHPHSCSLD